LGGVQTSKQGDTIMKKTVVLSIFTVILLSLVIEAAALTTSPNREYDADTTSYNTWGRVLYTRCTADFKCLYNNGSHLGGPVVKYLVVGFGNHVIRWVLDYNVTCVEHNYSGSYSSEDFLYMVLHPVAIWYFLSEGIPPLKLVAHQHHDFLFEDFLSGRWTVSLYVDSFDTPVRVDQYQR
jgi:hypothetical protein